MTACLTLNGFKLCITEVISTFIPLLSPPPTTPTGTRTTTIIIIINAGATSGRGRRTWLSCTCCVYIIYLHCTHVQFFILFFTGFFFFVILTRLQVRTAHTIVYARVRPAYLTTNLLPRALVQVPIPVYMIYYYYYYFNAQHYTMMIIIIIIFRRYPARCVHIIFMITIITITIIVVVVRKRIIYRQHYDIILYNVFTRNMLLYYYYNFPSSVFPHSSDSCIIFQRQISSVRPRKECTQHRHGSVRSV